MKRFIHNSRSTKWKAFLFFHSELEGLMAKECQPCLMSRSRAPRLWQPLPFWKQSSQITWPQLVKRNRGVALRGSQKQALQKTRTAMQQRGRRGCSGAGGWSRHCPFLSPWVEAYGPASATSLPAWGAAGPWGEGWQHPFPTQRGTQRRHDLTLTPKKKKTTGFLWPFATKLERVPMQGIHSVRFPSLPHTGAQTAPSTRAAGGASPWGGCVTGAAAGTCGKQCFLFFFFSLFSWFGKVINVMEVCCCFFWWGTEGK